jgi:hypothetical protein
MQFESMIRKPEEIVPGNILWRVQVTLNADGSVSVAVPYKVFPRTEAKRMSDTSYFFGIRGVSGGYIIPLALDAFAVGHSEESDLFRFTHSRLFRKRKDAINYGREMQSYQPTLEEMKYHFTIEGDEK